MFNNLELQGSSINEQNPEETSNLFALYNNRKLNTKARNAALHQTIP